MFAPEAPENKFLDYGHGKLENGSVYIEIDPNFTRNILVNDDHTILIYIQPEGDCNGLFVTNKSAEGFEVKELAGGQSNISFSYSIVATRGEERYEMIKVMYELQNMISASRVTIRLKVKNWNLKR